MPARYGPLAARALLRPFAEQLHEIVPLSRVRTACDVLCDSGAATAALAPHVTTMWCADVDPECAGMVAVAAGAHALRIDGDRIPLPDGCCDLAVSLFTLGFAPALRAEMARVVRRGGHVVVLSWRDDDMPPHERALARALQAQMSSVPPFLDAAAWHDPDARLVLRDVARFDSVELCWRALVDERPLHVAALAETRTRDAVFETFRQALHPYEAADGTLRIPMTCAAAVQEM